MPILFAAFGAVGALAGGSTAIANSVISAKHQSAEDEMKRHNSEMEKIAKSEKAFGSG